MGEKNVRFPNVQTCWQTISEGISYRRNAGLSSSESQGKGIGVPTVAEYADWSRAGGNITYPAAGIPSPDRPQGRLSRQQPRMLCRRHSRSRERGQDDTNGLLLWISQRKRAG